MHGTIENGGCHVPYEALLLRSSARKLRQVPPYQTSSRGGPQPSLEVKQLESARRSALSCSDSRPSGDTM
jgi:hypothetical protein